MLFGAGSLGSALGLESMAIEAAGGVSVTLGLAERQHDLLDPVDPVL